MTRITNGAVLSTLLLFALGCGGYGAVSPAAYDYSMALYAICNRQAEEKLVGVSKQIDEALVNNQITHAEARWLTNIIDDARDGEWESAAKSARRMMEDQVQPAN